MKSDSAKISVCIPVYNAEKTLLSCLESLACQDFSDWEVLVVNDGSSGCDDRGRNCKKIVKDFRKAHKLSKKQVIYLEHRSNLGLLEARRTLVEAAHSDFILMLDSDDCLLPGALASLYAGAERTDADIVHAGSEIFLDESKALDKSEMKVRAQEMLKKANRLYEGQLSGTDIFNGYLIQNNHIGFLWAKLIRRELYLKALSFIPFTHCVMAEDFLQYFLISFFAKKYEGLKRPVYRYTIDTGISSNHQIKDLEGWEKIASTANVFTILFLVIKENTEVFALSQEQMEALRLSSRSYLVNNIKQMRSQVIPDLQSQARDLLCDYWGTDFVEMMEKAMEK